LDREIVTRTWRVVVENANRDRALAQTAALDRAGFSVTTCGGPDTLPGRVCPLTNGDSCPWIDVADVVVHDLDLDNPAHQEVLRALRRAYPHVPVVLELAEATAREHAALLAGCHVIYPFDMDRLVQAVIDAVTTAKDQSRAVVP
jgi:DNA-binding NtrC family response regulator